MQFLTADADSGETCPVGVARRSVRVMPNLVIAYDWSQTSLGDVGAWPNAAKTIASMLLESDQPMFMLWGSERTLVYNDAYVPMLGCKHPAALGRPFLEVWHEARDSIQPLIDCVFEGGSNYMDDISILLDRGHGMQEAHFSFSHTPIRDANGNVDGLLCVCAETTDAVRARHERDRVVARLQESEDNYRHAIELNPQVAWTADPAGQLDHVSERWLDLTGTSGLGTSWAEALHPDDRQRTIEVWSESIATGTPYNIEHRVRIRTGEHRWYHSRAYPRFGAGGAVLRWYGSTEDVHARKLGEERLRSILETVPDAMIVIDEQGSIHSFSTAAERLFGYEAACIVGENVRVLMPEPQQAAHDGHLRSYKATGARKVIGVGRIVLGRRKDGSTFPMELSVGEVRTGTVRYFTGFIRDLTEKRKAEERIQEVQAELLHLSRFAALGEMASALAHELNQPLTAVSNYLGACQEIMKRLAEQGRSSNELIEHAVGEAAAQAHRAGAIIRSLRSFVGRTEGRRREESLGKLIEETCALALIGTREASIDVRIELDPAIGAIFVDRVQIQQVLLNLMRNAIEAMADSPVRQLSITGKPMCCGGRAEITVEDTGPGLAVEITAKLFQAFQTTKPDGMGVGLSICRTIVEGHGGKIDASTNSAGGATFRFSVPLSSRLEERDAA